MTTVKALIEMATAQFQAAGIPSARWDAELLVAHGLHETRLALYARPDSGVNEKDETALKELVLRRARREPLQHLIGAWEFWGRSFKVNSDVLIPRPETEFLIESALAFRGLLKEQEAPTAVDIGTGSGCLAITLAKEIPEARIYASDLSSEALSMAEENAKMHGVSDRIRFLKGDLYEPIKQQGLAGRVNLLVSNPPYIPGAVLMELEPEVRDHEPRIALDGGLDGLLFYRRLLAEAQTVLAPEGMMILELGQGQTADVIPLAVRSGLTVHHILRDYAGIPRVLTLVSSAQAHRSNV
jgi:release factor glutamine methyltransferase